MSVVMAVEHRGLLLLDREAGLVAVVMAVEHRGLLLLDREAGLGGGGGVCMCVVINTCKDIQYNREENQYCTFFCI